VDLAQRSWTADEFTGLFDEYIVLDSRDLMSKSLRFKVPNGLEACSLLSPGIGVGPLQDDMESYLLSDPVHRQFAIDVRGLLVNWLDAR
jgi:hypothetical protein